MARPKKIGLEYFPLDCQMDDKVEMLEGEHGLVGFAVYIKLLQHIYQTEAGELDMSVVFRWKTLGKQLEMPVETLQAHLETMFVVGLFDRDAYTTRQVLTSSGVQKRRGKVAGLREKDRSRKADADSEDSPEFSDGKPSENGGKGKGKDTNVSQKESKTPPFPEGVGEELGSEKKIEPAENSADSKAQPAPTQPPVAAAPLPAPLPGLPRRQPATPVSSWPAPDPAQPHLGVVLPFASPEFAALWGRWRVAVDERGGKYKGPNSEQEALYSLTQISGVGPENEALACAVIEQSLKNPTWKYFSPLSTIPAHGKPSFTRTSRLVGADSSQRHRLAGNAGFDGDQA